MSDQEKRIQEIRERANAGTSTDWFVPKNAKKIVFSQSTPALIVATCHDEADAQFIAHARQDIPYLLDLIESLQRETEPVPLTVDRMREIVLTHEDNAVWVQPTYWFNNGYAYRALLDLFQDHIIALDARTMTNGIDDETIDEYNYGKTWLAYATEPEGEGK